LILSGHLSLLACHDFSELCVLFPDLFFLSRVVAALLDLLCLERFDDAGHLSLNFVKLIVLLDKNIAILLLLLQILNK